MNNTPTLMQSEEERAPWNEKTKKIEVTISECLSSTQIITVPEDYNPENLKQYVIEQVILPSDCLEYEGYLEYWDIDDFCVSL